MVALGVPHGEFRPLSILLVDDEDAVRHGAIEMLRELGHHVIEANNADAALALLTEGRQPRR